MDKQDIPYIAFESEMARNERHIKRLWILCIILIVLLVVSNGIWIWNESQFEDVVTTTEVEAQQDGDNNFVSGGDLNYGADSTH